jgi:hypothetical protein
MNEYILEVLFMLFLFIVHFCVHVSRIDEISLLEEEKMVEIVRALNLLPFSLRPDIHIFCGNYHPLRK